jgi:hypothetical protein
MTYMVFIEGKQPPMKKHDLLVDAEGEAELLATHPEYKMKKIYVIEVVQTYEPIVTREWKKK